MRPEFEGEKVGIIEGIDGLIVTSAKQAGNSGAGALFLAQHMGANRIIMLGYDCKEGADGIRHWHGSHVYGLGNAESLPKFKGQFEKIGPDLAGIEVINCTRDTVLTCFDRGELEEWI